MRPAPRGAMGQVSRSRHLKRQAPERPPRKREGGPTAASPQNLPNISTPKNIAQTTPVKAPPPRGSDR
jgi:hypothetical protein